MNTIELYIRGKRKVFSGPSCWAELTPRQAVGVARLKASAADQPELLFAGLRLLYGMKPSHQRWLFDRLFLLRKKLSAEQIEKALLQGQSLLDTLLWLGEPDPEARFMVQRFRRLDFHYGRPGILLRRLIDFRRYYGPADAMTESSFGEFMFAEAAFSTGNRALLAAVLYRPKGEVFSRQRVDARLKRFTGLDAGLLGCIEQNYLDTKRRLQRRFPNVFPAHLSESSSTPAAPAKPTNWLEIAIGLAKLDPTKIPDIEKQNLYLVLKVLDEQIRQADELDRQLAKQR
jgi:hypothetical protein